MPLVPPIAALTAAGIVEGAAALSRWSPLRRRHAVLLVAALVAAVLPPARRLVEADRRLARADTRTQAAEWLRNQAGPDALMVPLVGYSSVYAIPAEGSAACRTALPSALDAPVTTMPPIHMAGWERWAPAVAQGRAGWGAVAERALTDYWNMPLVTPANGDYVAFGQPLLACGKPTFIGNVPRPDPSCFEEVVRFSPGRPSCDAVYDLFDQFYLPYAVFTGIERPGPEITIYRNRCGRRPS